MLSSSDTLGPTRVIIVDDSPSSVLYLRQLVEENIAECEAMTFTDSRAALNFCVDGSTDLVVVDYHMPPPDGLQFIEQYRKVPARRDVPIVMVTSEDATDVRYMALQLGATDFLTKPVDKIEFITRTRNLLALSISRKALAGRAKRLAEEVKAATRSLVERERESILFLCRAAEHRDPETAAHLLRMATYSQMIAWNLGMNTDETELVFMAAPMHDIGKIGIPDAILLKQGPLTAEERLKMEQHTVFGWKILDGSTSPLLQMAANIALSHHERWDGSGYPRGLTGVSIPLVGRIAAVADVFDALITKRSYKPAWPLEKASAYVLANRGTAFDPECVDAFMAGWDAVGQVAKAEGNAAEFSATPLAYCPSSTPPVRIFSAPEG